MPDNTPKLLMPYIVASQAQKEVSHNEALNIIDVVAQPVVLDMIFTPPGSPSRGDTYIISGGTATGAWVGYETYIAAYYDTWIFLQPLEGWQFRNVADGKTYEFNGTGWAEVSAYTPSAPTEQIPSITSPWINYGGGFQGVHYFKNAEGLVTIEGLIQAPGGSTTVDVTLFTLIAGYRPAANLMFHCWDGGGGNRIDVNSDGSVIMRNGNTAFTSLSGISFYAA